LQLKFEYNTYTLTDKDLIKILDFRTGFNRQSMDAIILDIASEVNHDPQNPKFIFENGRVTEFQPALDGIRIDNEGLKDKIINSLNQIENSNDKIIAFDIPIQKTPPEVTTDGINNLGIKELIGRGASTYFHSITSRVHNVVLAASRINGTLVKPGDTFSFNDTLGDVSQFTGYQQAYIISEGKTILGDGGGVCQVSTTLFRSVLNAGLPIIERQAHAYRVGYYEQDSPPGIDATVYGPSPDFKFKNDTPAYILIEAKADPKKYSLVFELYGTSDGRVSSISKPVVTNIVSPPEDLYQDDPALPAGTIKQIDYKAWGAKVTFNHKVERNGVTIFSKTFLSNYRPWQAVYLRGTGPAI
jgi:vancomycin resistance protein YoaR